MKIVHIGDATGGGAAHAMSRLHDALQRLGVDSHRLVRKPSRLGDAVEIIATRGDQDDLFPVLREVVVRQYVVLNRTSVTNTHFSLYIDGADVSRVPLVAASDVVHLHWTASFQTPSDVRALLNAKPVVWTLHDLAPLTGGCHFPAGCEGYAADCADCPQLAADPFDVTATTLRDKTTLWEGRRPTFVAPSRYMAERARDSAVAQAAGASIVHIPHGVDVTAFRPRSKAGARLAMGLPPDRSYVLCGSHHNAEQRKGMRSLGRVLAAATARSPRAPLDLTLLTVGEPKLDLRELDGIEVVQLGRVAEVEMPTVYAAADVFLHLAVEDNFPLMLLEALSCGTPAVAFDVGGIAEIVDDEVCGRLAAAGDELGMAAALSSLLGDRQRLDRMSENARARAEEHFSAASSAQRHAELYDDVAKHRPAPGRPAAPLPEAALEKIFPRWSAACLVQEVALAHEHAALLEEESAAKSAHAAALEREAAALTASLADQFRQVQEKEAELHAVHTVAQERKALAETLHAAAAKAEALTTRLRAEILERDELLAERDMTVAELRAEVELLHGVAADRGKLIEDLHRAAEVFELHLAEQTRQVQEKEAELHAAHAVAQERNVLAETLHAAAAKAEALMARLRAEILERDELLAERDMTVAELRAEVELLHVVAADRGKLIEDLHRAAEGLALHLREQTRQVIEKEAELAAIRDIAQQRERLAQELHASAARLEAQAASLQGAVRARDDLVAELRATVNEQGAEIVLAHGAASERQRLVEDLNRIAEERAAIIDQLAGSAHAVAASSPP